MIPIGFLSNNGPSFFDRNWPTVLVLWLIFLISCVTIRFSFVRRSDPGNFSAAEVIEGIPQNDSRLLEYIHAYFLYPPPYSPSTYNYSISPLNVKRESITADVLKILENKLNGFFVECRAFDGDALSQTLDLELKSNWTGILLEPDPYIFPKLLTKQRKAWLINGCLSPDPTAHSIDFLLRHGHGQGHDQNDTDSSTKNTHPLTKSVLSASGHSYRDSTGQMWTKLKVPCFPLFSITSALNIKSIDLLVLDAQGLELQILFNIPWTSLEISIIIANVESIPEGADGLKYFLHLKGYDLLSATGKFYTFVHKNLIAVSDNDNAI